PLRWKRYFILRRMKLNKRYISSVILLILFGWAMISFYDMQIQFAGIVKDSEPPWELTLNFLPIALTIIVGTIISIFVSRKEPNKKGATIKALYLPQPFKEDDELEKEITAKATRASYISMWIVAPILAAFILVYPFIIDAVPYYPMI